VGAVLDALRMVQRGAPAVVVLRGEPGIGKTALVRTIVEQAGRLGFHAAYSAAHEDDRLAPLTSIGPALRFGVAPLISSTDFMNLATLHEQPLWLAERLAMLVERRAEDGPILLAVDDAQWCDPLSVFILRVLPKRLIAAPIAWVLASREVPGGGPAEHVIDAARPEVPVTVLDLAPLAQDAVLAVATDRLGTRPDPAVLRRLADAHGNPFLTVQLLEGLFDPAISDNAKAAVPVGLLDGVRRRVAATSDRCRELLRTAAVFGPEFPLGDVAALLGVPAARLTEPLVAAIDAGLLVDEGNVVRFRHDLLRQAVYEDLPPSGRRALHRAIADHLLASGRGYAAAAPHVLATAGPGDAAAADVLRKAAHEVLETMSTTSVTFIRQAFELIDAKDPNCGEIGVEAVAILVADRQFAEAARFADTLLAGTLSADLRARVQLLLLPRLWSTDQHAEILARTTDPGARPDLAARLGAYRALATGEPVEPGDDPIAAVVAILAAAESARRNQDLRRTHARYARARAAAQGLTGDGAPSAGEVALRELLALARLDDIDGAVAGLDDPARFGNSWHAPQLALLRAQLSFGAGRLDDTEEAIATATALMAELFDDVPGPRVRELATLLALLRGEAAPARNAESPLARAVMADADIAPLLRADHDFPWPEELLVGSACAAHHRGDAKTVRAAADLLAERAARNPDVASVTGARLLVDALSTGDFEPALALLRESPRPLLAARAEEEYGRSVVDSTDRRAGLDALDAAHDRYAELGATASATRVQRLLQSAGARRRRWAPIQRRPETGWDALTEMERRVALLVAEGHTNRSAAEVLVLSPSTISTHLRAVFSKLGVHSRVQLANLVLRKDDPPAG
jgi:DNA-binding CsgD family transcriptional regulator